MCESGKPWWIVPGGDPDTPFRRVEEGKPGGINLKQLHRSLHANKSDEFDDILDLAKSDESETEKVKYLDEEGLTENTVVIYTSDQGMFLGEDMSA